MNDWDRYAPWQPRVTPTFLDWDAFDGPMTWVRGMQTKRSELIDVAAAFQERLNQDDDEVITDIDELFLIGCGFLSIGVFGVFDLRRVPFATGLYSVAQIGGMTSFSKDLVWPLYASVTVQPQPAVDKALMIKIIAHGPESATISSVVCDVSEDGRLRSVGKVMTKP